MEPIERAAHVSVGRACCFCGLAIMCLMVGFAYDPELAARVGGIFALITSIVLQVKAWYARFVPYKHTETWIILPVSDRPPSPIAQDMITSVLRQVYLVYAWYTAVTGAALLAASLLLGLLIR
jgi:hypothetical protein